MKHLYLLAICYLMIQQVCAQDPVYAQKGITVAGGNGSGSGANQLSSPNGIAIDAAGNLYLADTYNNRIQKWAPGAASGITIAGGNGAGGAANQLNNPSALCFDNAGNMYVADLSNYRIQKFAPGSATGVTVAGYGPLLGPGSTPGYLNSPIGVAVDAAGNIYVAEYSNQRIQKFTPGSTAGVVIIGKALFPGPGPSELYYPTDITIDAAGNLYVSDSYNYRVQKFAPGSSAGVTVAGGNGYGAGSNQLSFPSGVAVDPKGNVFVTDYTYLTPSTNDRIQRWAPGATAGTTVAGGNGNGDAANQFSTPSKLALDAAGNLYVCDSYNNRIQKFPLVSMRTCPDNIVIAAASCTGKTTISWAAPRDSFPDFITIPSYLDPASGQLEYLGALNGHGYYRSASFYSWSDARYICEFIGDTGVSGHLTAITSAAENAFITNLLSGRSLFPWIGLYNSGKPGSFRWVTGEPLAYTNWAAGEPNNFTSNPANVAEPHVHLYPSGQWNDQSRLSLPFLAEFDQPLVQYRQISGVANGSAQSTGLYTICYERTNRITGSKDSCCFTVTIQCTAGTAAATGLAAPAGSSPEVKTSGMNRHAIPPAAQKKRTEVKKQSP